MHQMHDINNIVKQHDWYRVVYFQRYNHTVVDESVTGLIDYRWEDTRNQIKTKIFFNHNIRTPVLYKSRADTTQATIDYI